MNVFTRPLDLAGLTESAAHGPERRSVSPTSDDIRGSIMRRRFWISAALTLPLLILALSGRTHGPAFNGLVPAATAGFLALVLATPVVLWGGWPLLVDAWHLIVAKRPSVVALAGVTVAVTYLYGVIAAFLPNAPATSFQLSDGLSPVYFGAAAVMTVLALLGRFLAIDADNRMSTAASGRGRLSRGKRLVVTAPRQGIRSIGELPETVSGTFICVVVSAAAATFIGWAIWGPEPTIAYALANTVVVLIIASPCALGLAKAVPFAVINARGADAGILFESGAAIEAMWDSDTLVIDKTGILTGGRPRLVTVEPTYARVDLEFLRLAASLEQLVEHPLASAIVVGARERGLELVDAGEFEEIPGMGVHGTVQRHSVVVGNPFLVKGRAALSEKVEARADQLCADGQTVLFVAVDGVVVGLLGVANPVRNDAQEIIRELQAEGMDTVMITGDQRATAEAIARPLGINRVNAEILPDEKTGVVQRIQDEDRTVAVVWNVIDYGSATAKIDISCEPGTASDEVTRRPEITLTGGDLRTVLRARRLSRAAMRIARHNLLFALIFIGLGVPIAAGVLYPAFGWLPSPMIAMAAVIFGSLAVIGNALRLRYRDLESATTFREPMKGD